MKYEKPEIDIFEIPEEEEASNNHGGMIKCSVCGTNCNCPGNSCGHRENCKTW